MKSKEEIFEDCLSHSDLGSYSFKNIMETEGNFNSLVNVGLKAMQAYADQFKGENEAIMERVNVLEKALSDLINSWDARCNEREKLMHNSEHDFDYWSPAASMVESQYIAAARIALSNAIPQV